MGGVGKSDVEAPAPQACPYDVDPEALLAMNEVGERADLAMARFAGLS